MNIISFDIGIKHLSYCLLTLHSDYTFTILEWDIINLCDDNFSCNCLSKSKICGKSASFFKQNNYYCKVHAKQQSFKIPIFDSIHKLKKIELMEYASLKSIPFLKTNTKQIMIDLVSDVYHDEHLDIIKKINGNKINLIDIGIAIKHKLDNITIHIDKVIIENQIKQTMINIQYMIAQYYIMNHINDIIIYHASNKLNFEDKPKIKTNYKERKSMSIQHTQPLLDDKWLPLFMNHKKKDDLADCFLQAYSYIRKLPQIMQVPNPSELSGV